ncbi:hypothetical protein C5167_009553 [Papaver somniferum]|uniref:Mitochondrial import inner membrane translocase subunit TIM50 n=1 Tax=Papaver somniferum TaxID=3469 RepID=A0A4Y7K0N2_PAPSO|nr:hypothetical protein C5167_009553 [Papaver somniferum]
MSRIVRSRILSYLSKNSKPFSSSTSANSPKEPTISSVSTPEKKPWGILKYGIFGAFTGLAATVGYATYAYTSEEIDIKTKAFRESANRNIGDDASSLEKLGGLFYSVATTVPAKSVELYLDLRRTFEEHVRGFTEPSSEKLLPDLPPQEKQIFTLVLDLNETLVYSDRTVIFFSITRPIGVVFSLYTLV